MNEFEIMFDKESPALLGEKIKIRVNSNNKEGYKYKFFIGYQSDRRWSWVPIQDFSMSNECIWIPEKADSYMIMVNIQDEAGKNTSIRNEFRIKTEIESSNKEEDTEVNNNNKKLIKDVIIDKTSLTLGEKINLDVLTSEDEIILYRFWIRGSQGWEPLRDYTPENKFTYTTNRAMDGEILIECKRPSSSDNVDDFTTVKFKVKDQPTIEVTSFECLSDKLLVGEELVFKVGVNLESSRTILYKFLRVDKNGRTTCVQDYSTKSVISFYEKEKGKYKLLCYVRDIFSNKPYDDRAAMIYYVKPYEEIKIKSFSSELSSPQLSGNTIAFKTKVQGGNEVLYRYIVEGTVAEDTGYIRSKIFNWETKSEGEYKIKVLVKDMSFNGEYEDTKEINFKVDKKGEKPVNILSVNASKTRGCIKGEPINLKVKAEGGTELKYSFIVYKDGKEKERINYGAMNWVNFTPEESGEYEVEVRVLDKYSLRDYDAHDYLFLKVKDYQEAEIDYVLLSQKEVYLVGDIIELETVAQNTKNILLRYVTKINGHEVEDTGYIKSNSLKIKPKCPGKYTFRIYAKNILCKDEFDTKKEVSIYVNESTPVTNTKVTLESEEVIEGREITFEASSEGGKEVCYEFYIMEKGNWVRVQSYSRKNYYTFLPFTTGDYKVLVLSKSYYKKVNYEDYAYLEFKVKAEVLQGTM
ncbi:triple tyrosine motif-containing protein [Clostridium tertium]|uniref:Y_Y_Y domain protein n=1 Tax=Clostridium tertium TaxID=1559 RepID=A0A6N3GSW0_9CLOT